VKPAFKTSRVLSSATLAALAVCLLAGCASTASRKKIYDRYAARVAELNRPATKPVAARPTAAPATATAPAPAARAAADKTPETSDRRPIKTSGVTNAEPAKAPPVQIIAPKPAEKIDPVKPAEPVAAPVMPAPPTSAPPVSAPPVSEPPAPEPLASVQSAPTQAAPAQSPPEAQSNSVPSAPAAASEPAGSEMPFSADSVAYSLKQGDVVQVSLRGIPAPEAIESVIDEHGMISMPFINEVRAAGQSASELARNIRQTYLDQGIYRNISVTVVVPTRYYFIQGEIRGPGRFQLVSAMRVSQAIAASGAYTEYASGQVLIRRGGKVFKVIKNARRLELAPDDDILLEPDDIIEVKRSLW
jgi:protein involved in polysaccharide export with SLBB domain